MYGNIPNVIKRLQPEEYVVKVGRYLTVEFYYTENGTVPASGFYGSRSDDEKRRFLHIVEHLTDEPPGKPLPKTMFNLEDAKEQIYAIKPFAGRYLGFFATGKKFIIAETYVKQTQQLGKREKRYVKAAIKTKKTYDERNNRGDYYGKE